MDNRLAALLMACVSFFLAPLVFGQEARGESEPPGLLLSSDRRTFGILPNAGGRSFGGGFGYEGAPAKALVDIDANGRLDKVSDYDLRLGHGDTHFGAAPVIFESGFLVAAGGDFDEDGYGDVLILEPRGEEFHLFCGEPAGTLRYGGVALRVDVNSFGAQLPIVTDLDGDGHLDVAGTMPLYVGFGDFYARRSPR